MGSLLCTVHWNILWENRKKWRRSKYLKSSEQASQFTMNREGLCWGPRPSALRTRLMHFPSENWIQDAKVF
jgi:hypothetical protein